MKRSADSSNVNNITTRQPLSSRRTRSTTRHEQEKKAMAERQLVRAAEQHARASALMSTSLLRSLPVVLSSGYLYQYCCMTAAATCQDWYHTWKEIEDRLPDNARVHHFMASPRCCYPLWVRFTHGLTEALASPGFVRQVWDKVNALKVAAKPTPGARAKAKAALPVWGVDVQVAELYVWGPNQYNDGGLSIRYGKKKNVTFRTYKTTVVIYDWNKRNTLAVSLDSNLVLWTGIRNRTVYNEEPLWP
jgi:hypothetical protein